MNIVWLFQTALYSLSMGLLYFYSGSALTGLVAAALAGLLHGSALAYMGLRDQRPPPPAIEAPPKARRADKPKRRRNR